MDVDERAAARAKVVAAANSGESPTAHYSKPDLEWAFRGCEDELEQLEARAAERREELKVARLRAQAAEMVPSILNEWHREEQAALRARAVAEARRRLGLDETSGS